MTDSLDKILQAKALEKKKVLEEENKKEEDKALFPIRAHIAKLEEAKNKLQEILEISWKNWTEDSREIRGSAHSKGQHLDALMEKHQDVLKDLGVQDREHIVANEEFTEAPEVVAYKKATEQSENLTLANDTVREELSGLGITLPENFTYDEVEKCVKEKRDSLDEELLAEKLKTPEGKAEAVGRIAEELKSKIPGTTLVKEKDKTEVTLGSGYQKATISISKDGVKFIDWKNARLVPEEIGGVEKTYGADIGKEALKEAYGKNIDRAFDNFDKNGEQVNFLLKGLEPADPKLAVEAKKAFDEFKAVSGESFKNAIKDKVAELEGQGLRAGNRDFYDGVDTISRLTEYKDGEDKIRDLIDRPATFPPKFDWMNLKLKIEKRTDQNKALLDALNAVKTQEQLNHLMTWGSNDRKDGTIGKMHWDTIHQQKFFDKVEKWDRDEGIVDATFHLPGDTYDAKLNSFASKFTHYGDASQYLQEKSTALETEKKKIKEKINVGVDALLTQRELQKIMKDENLHGSIEDAARNLESQKEAGLRVLTELAKLEQSLPKGEQITLNGTELEIPSIGKSIEELKQKIETKRAELEVLSTKINQDKKPLFGKERWQTAHDKLLEEKNELETTIRTMENNDMRELTNKTWRLIAGLKESISSGLSYTRPFSDIIRKQKMMGTSSEIFKNAREEIEAVINQKLPESVTKKYNEYKVLEAQLG